MGEPESGHSVHAGQLEILPFADAYARLCINAQVAAFCDKLPETGAAVTPHRLYMPSPAISLNHINGT